MLRCHGFIADDSTAWRRPWQAGTPTSDARMTTGDVAHIGDIDTSAIRSGVQPPAFVQTRLSPRLLVLVTGLARACLTAPAPRSSEPGCVESWGSCRSFHQDALAFEPEPMAISRIRVVTEKRHLVTDHCPSTQHEHRCRGRAEECQFHRPRPPPRASRPARYNTDVDASRRDVAPGYVEPVANRRPAASVMQRRLRAAWLRRRPGKAESVIRPRETPAGIAPDTSGTRTRCNRPEAAEQSAGVDVEPAYPVSCSLPVEAIASLAPLTASERRFLPSADDSLKIP